MPFNSFEKHRLIKMSEWFTCNNYKEKIPNNMVYLFVSYREVDLKYQRITITTFIIYMNISLHYFPFAIILCFIIYKIISSIFPVYNFTVLQYCVVFL